MPDAYVHVYVEPGALSQAAEEIAGSPVVEAAHLVTGNHDLEVQLVVEDRDDIAQAVTEEIHGVTGVLDTETHVAFDPAGLQDRR